MTADDTICRLCAGSIALFYQTSYRNYWQCQFCHSIQLSASQLPEPDREKALYLTHNNDIDDPRYQAFTLPITNAIISDQSIDKTGLDYGAGPGPVISAQLKKQGFDIALYDPYFHNNIKVLETIYDFIFSCEVIEHFYHPAEAFHRLRQLLKPGGSFYCMTELYEKQIDFARWYYKNDPTHVFFYHPDSLPVICRQFGFKAVQRHGRLIIFSG